jgi:hypothetical protein
MHFTHVNSGINASKKDLTPVVPYRSLVVAANSDAHVTFIIDFRGDNHRPAANLTVLYILLRVHRAINEKLDGFAAVRAVVVYRL